MLRLSTRVLPEVVHRAVPALVTRCRLHQARHYHAEKTLFAANLPPQPASHGVFDGPEPSFSSVRDIPCLKWTSAQPFPCDNGGVLEEMTVAYETWGTLNEARDNVIMVHSILNASSHAAHNEANPSAGWWEPFIGPGGIVDTDKFFVISSNVLGSCFGTTGPSSINPATNVPYAMSFPIITIFDMVRAQFRLLDALGIDQVYACVGGSLGGMQALAAAAMFPDRVNRLVSVSATSQSHPTSIALRYAQRCMVMSDPDWCNGNYYATGRFPQAGLKQARLVSQIAYRSGPEWERRFGRNRVTQTGPHTFYPDFNIEAYLDHMSSASIHRFDPNSLLYILKALDLFDMGHGFASVTEGLKRVVCPTLVLGVQSDILIPSWQQKELASRLKEAGNDNVAYYELDALYGHDTFLLDVHNVGAAVKGHLEHVD